MGPHWYPQGETDVWSFLWVEPHIWPGIARLTASPGEHLLYGLMRRCFTYLFRSLLAHTSQ